MASLYSTKVIASEAVTVRSAAKVGLLDLKLRLPHGLDGRCDATNPEQFFAGA